MINKELSSVRNFLFPSPSNPPCVSVKRKYIFPPIYKSIFTLHNSFYDQGALGSPNSHNIPHAMGTERAKYDGKTKAIQAASEAINSSCCLGGKRIEASRMQYPGRAAILIGAILFCWLTVWFRIYSYIAHKSLRDGIESAQIQSVQESLGIVLLPDCDGKNRLIPMKSKEAHLTSLGINEEELKTDCYRFKNFVVTERFDFQAAELAKQTVQIRDKIKKWNQGGFVWGGIRGLRADLATVMHSSFYRQLRGQNCKAVNFLQYVAIKLLAANGSEVLKTYGKRWLRPIEQSRVEVDEFAGRMAEYGNRFGFSYKNIFSKIFWSLAHPFLAMHSLESHFDPLGYNASSMNPNFSAHAFSFEGKQICFYYGPGPTADAIFEHGVLPAYKKFGVFELRLNHQDVVKTAEYYRVQKLQEVADQSRETLHHAILGFDTKMRYVSAHADRFHLHEEKLFENPKLYIEEFFHEYEIYISNNLRKIGDNPKNDNGFCISKSLLSDSQFQAAVDGAKTFCQKLSCDHRNLFWNDKMKTKEGRIEMARMMQLVVDAYIALALTYNAFGKIDQEMIERSLNERFDRDLTAVRTSGACKQDIDRGVIENIVLRLFFRWTTDSSPLSAPEAYEMAGAIFARARMAADRAIMDKRYKILDDLLHFIGASRSKENQRDGVNQAHDCLKEYWRTLRKTLPGSVPASA